MTRHRLHFAGSLWLAMVLTSYAQPFAQPPGLQMPTPGHIPVSTDNATNVRDWVEGRRTNRAVVPGLGKGLSPEMLRQMMELLDGQNPEDLRKLAEKVGDPKDFADPERVERMRELLDRNPDLRDPKKVEELLARIRAKGEGADLDPKKLDDLLKNLDRTKKPLPKVDVGKGPPPDVGPAPERKIPDERAMEAARWAKENFGDSPAVADLIASMGKAYAERSTDKSLSFMPDMTDELGRFSKWTRNKFKDPNLNMNLPKFNGPKFNPPDALNIRLPRWNFMPSFDFAGFSIAGLSSLFFFQILFLMVGAVGWLMWRSGWFPGQATLFGSKVAGAAGLLDVNAVHSRQELVEAFEAISVNQCGEEATTWNHRIIAGELGAENPTRQEAAGSLAGLYEHARYAPSDDDLTRDEFAKARRDISTLCAEARV